MSKRILIFSFAYYPDLVSGAEIPVRKITDRIASPDLLFDMVTWRHRKDLPLSERIGNVNVHRVDSSKLLFSVFAFLSARRLHKERHYDAIWSIMANRAGFAAALFKIFNPSVKYILTLQEGDPFDYPEKRMGVLRFVLKGLFKKIFTKADRITAISNYLAGWARQMGFDKKVDLVPNGVDVSLFSRKFTDEEKKDVRTEIGKNGGDIFAVTVSRLVKKNAVDDVIKALKDLPDNFKFLVIGSGDEEAALRGLSSDIGVADRVIFLGSVPYEEVPKYLSVSDVFIRPSLTEGMGNSFIEAMVAGIPVVATPVGGIVDFLFDPDRNPGKRPTGLFCKVRDPEDIAEKIKRAVRDGALRGTMVANAKELAVKNYDWEVVAGKMGAVIKEI